ncbi:hypothetical protein [Acinetobacter sp. TSRC1-2]|uniref:hypothetical protein n=1 Tax=unclassified Acinetobacter TaxID=196816 RepID=UPI003CEDB10E
MIKLKHLALLSGLVLAACATGDHHRLNKSLQQYVGQTAAQVRSQLDLSKIGFKTTQGPIQTVESLSYTIVRDMNIPMGTPNISHSISMGAPMPTPSNGGYNIEMKCQVWFNLKDEIVQSIRYTGRAC